MTVSIQIPLEMSERLERLALATDRSAATLATEALERFLAEGEWEVDRLDAAMADAEEGVFISNEAVTSWLLSWGTNAETKAPEPDVFEPKR
jgi:predicted transcriptional regulator